MSHKTRSHEKPKARAARPKAGTTPLPVIRCGYDDLVDPTTLKLGEKNDWHKHPKEQLELYGKIILETGWRRAVVVSNRSGQVVKGNGATLTALAGGWSQIPVEFQDYDSEQQELADMIADNKLAELAGTDEAKLRVILQGLDGKIDLQLAGLTLEDIADLKLSPEAQAATAQFPITANLHESHDYVLIITDNTPDFLHLQNLCGVRTEKSFKNSHIGTGHAVPFKRFLAALRKNRHTLDEPGLDHEHAPPPAKRAVRDLRPRKPKAGLSRDHKPPSRPPRHRQRTHPKA